jgi:glycosyltransferase involved in cell wall biosynthesis
MSALVNPLRLAIVASSLRRGGAEKQTYYMARALREAGVDAQCFYLGDGGYYEAALQSAGVPTLKIYESRKPLSILGRLIRAFLEFRPQIVLAAQFGDLLYATPAGRSCGAMVLGGIRSDGIQDLDSHGRLCRWMVRFSHGLVANSWQARQNLILRKIPQEKIEVLPNVIDIENFDEQSQLSPNFSLPRNRIIAAAVGSLHPCKRLDRFLDALALARHSEPSLAGVIAGTDAGAKAELQARAGDLGLLPDGVTFLGEVDRIPALLARVALLMLTSDYEGFPNVLLEAMAAGLPVISTPVGDARSIVQDGTTGYIMEPADTVGMARKMVHLARSPLIRNLLGKAGRRRVEQEYSHKSLPVRLRDVLRRMAGQCRSSAVCEALECGGSSTGLGPPSSPLILEQPTV